MPHTRFPLLLLLLLLLLPFFFFIVSGNPTREEGSIVDSIWRDYSPPSPPPPSPFNPPSCSCEEDFGGVGSFDTLCRLSSSAELSEDVYIKGKGSLDLLAGVVLSCSIPGCVFSANLSGTITLRRRSAIIAGTVKLAGSSVSVGDEAALSTVALGGEPPQQTSGVPIGTHGDGGGHGGRGASCFVNEGQRQEESWGGDAYAWSTLSRPDSYGSRGGSTSVEEDFGGGGGGRIWLEIEGVFEVNGSVDASGGSGGRRGGGGSGGSIYILASKM